MNKYVNTWYLGGAWGRFQASFLKILSRELPRTLMFPTGAPRSPTLFSPRRPSSGLQLLRCKGCLSSCPLWGHRFLPPFSQGWLVVLMSTQPRCLVLLQLIFYAADLLPTWNQFLLNLCNEVKALPFIIQVTLGDFTQPLPGSFSSQVKWG